MKKRNLKILFASLFAVATLAIAGLFLAIFSVLPSPKEIAKNFNSVSPKKQVIQNESTDPDQKYNSKPNNSIYEDEKSESSMVNAADSVGDSADKSKDAEQIGKMLDEDPRDLQVCRSLGRTRLVNSNGKDKLNLSDIFSEKLREDPVVEAYRFAVRNVFQDEAIAPLIREILSVLNVPQTGNESSSLDKINFYSRAAYATASLYARRSSFEAVGNRAMHLAMVAQIAALKPELANDVSVSSFCDSLERSIAASETVDIKEERKEILKLISYAGLTPQELGLDPDSYMKFRVKNTDKSINFTLSSKDSEESQKN